MKLNKLIAGAAAIAMLGSLATAVPAMAESSHTMTVDYSSLASFRANGDNNTTFTQYYYFDSATDSTVSTKEENEIQGANRFGAFMRFDLSSVKDIIDNPANSSVSVKLIINKRSSGSGDLAIWEWSDEKWNDPSIINNMRGETAKEIVSTLKTEHPHFGDAKKEGESESELPIASASISSNIWSIDITNYVTKLSDSENVDFLLSTRYYDTNNAGAVASNTDNKPHIYLYGDNRPQIICTYDLNEAKIGEVYYNTFEEAIQKAESGATIELLDDVTVDSAIYANKPDIFSTAGDTTKKDLTIIGNNKTITLNGKLEIDAFSTLTVSNVNFAGDKDVDMKGSTVINANDATFSKLSLGGAGDASKGTLKECYVKSLSTYGRITIDNTRVDEVVFSNVKASGDTPCIIMTNNSTVASANLLAVESPILSYTLFEGKGAPATITGVPEGYEYSNGVLLKKQAETSPSASYKLIKSWDDETDPASAWELTVNPGTYTIDSFTLTIKDSNNNTHKATESPENTNVSGGAVVFGVAVNKAESFVQGMTLNVTSGSADSSIDAALAE